MKTPASPWCALAWLVMMTGLARAQSGDEKIAPKPARAKPLANSSSSEAAAIAGASDCFVLRDELHKKAAGAKALALHRAVVDAMFNNPGAAEKTLLAVIRSHPDP